MSNNLVWNFKFVGTVDAAPLSEEAIKAVGALLREHGAVGAVLFWQDTRGSASPDGVKRW